MTPSELTYVINAMKKAGKIHQSMTPFEFIDAIKDMQKTGEIDPMITVSFAYLRHDHDQTEVRKLLNNTQQITGQKKPAKVIPIANHMSPWETRNAPPDIRVLTNRLFEESKIKAFKAFAAHDYVNFTAWARVWTRLNVVLELEENSPFVPLADHAREILEGLQEKDERECKLCYKSKTRALKALASYTYVSFARWAIVWSQMNAFSENPQPSPFEPLADHAREILRELQENDKR